VAERKEWVTVKEAAELAGRTERTIYGWIDQNRLAVIRDNRNRVLVLAGTVARLGQELRAGRPRESHRK